MKSWEFKGLAIFDVKFRMNPKSLWHLWLSLLIPQLDMHSSPLLESSNSPHYQLHNFYD